MTYDPYEKISALALALDRARRMVKDRAEKHPFSNARNMAEQLLVQIDSALEGTAHEKLKKEPDRETL